MDFSEKLLLFRERSRPMGGGGVSLRCVLRLEAFTLCTRHKGPWALSSTAVCEEAVPCGTSTALGAPAAFCELDRLRLALRTGVAGLDGVATSLLVLEEDAMVLRAKLGSAGDGFVPLESAWLMPPSEPSKA